MQVELSDEERAALAGQARRMRQHEIDLAEEAAVHYEDDFPGKTGAHERLALFWAQIVAKLQPQDTAGERNRKYLEALEETAQEAYERERERRGETPRDAAVKRRGETG